MTGVVVPSLMDPPHPMHWNFACKHVESLHHKVAGTNNKGSGKHKGVAQSPQSTLSRDGPSNELWMTCADSEKSGVATCAASKKPGASAKVKGREEAVPVVTPKTMLTVLAYLGAIYEWVLIDYTSAKLYRDTTFDARVAFLYALHSKGNPGLGIPGDSDMQGKCGVTVDGDPVTWQRGGLLSCLSAVFKQPTDLCPGP